jgi:uncharacterized protein
VAWLVREGEVLASLEVARGRRARARGLLGRDGIDGAIYLVPCRSVHTLLMRFPIDVAFVDEDLVVQRVVQLRPGRIARPCWKAHGVIEAEAGSFASWELRQGDTLEVRE